MSTLEDIAEFAVPAEPTEAPAPRDAREPTPEVVARAKQLVQQLKGGSFSTEQQDVDQKTKISFLAHILEGAAFKKEYPLFDGQMKVVFHTIPATWENEVLRHVSKEVEGSERKVLYNRYLALISFCLISYRHSVKPDIETSPLTTLQPQQLPALLKSLEAMFSRTELLLLEGVFKEYRDLLTRLLKEAHTPSFWQTPS